MSKEKLAESDISSDEAGERVDQSSNTDEIIDEMVANQPKIIAFLRHKGVNENIVEDIAQEAFMKTLRTSSSFKGQSSVLSWQCSIAWNAYIDIMRSRKNRDYLHMEFKEEILPNSINPNPDISGASANPLEQLILKEGNAAEIERIKAAVNKLSEKHKQTIDLHLEGKSDPEIAEILHIPINTVRSRIFNAREKLAKDLKIKRN